MLYGDLNGKEIQKGGDVCIHSTQSFWWHGLVLWKMIFPWTGVGGWFQDDSSALHLLCILFLLLLHQFHLRSSGIRSQRFSSVTQSCPTLFDPMGRQGTPGLPVHHHLPEFTHTHVHRVGDAIQPSHPLPSPFPPAPNPSQHQSLFQWDNSSHEVAKAGSSKKQENSRKTSISALLTMPKPLTVWITINCGKFFKKWEYQTTWPASWETYMQLRKQQLELDMEQQTGCK